MQEQFDIALNPDEVIELDSSTDSKFSRHLIIPLSVAAFASNSHAGAFVAGLLQAAAESNAAGQLYLQKVSLARWLLAQAAEKHLSAHLNEAADAACMIVRLGTAIAAFCPYAIP